MLPVRQRTNTDCFKCCVATLMDWPYDFVPDFMNKTSDMPEALMWHEVKEMDDWFAARKLILIRYPVMLKDPVNAIQFISETQPASRYILTGLTRKGVGHAWIVNEREIAFDPAQPSQPVYTCLDGGYFVAYFIGQKL